MSSCVSSMVYLELVVSVYINVHALTKLFISIVTCRAALLLVVSYQTGAAKRGTISRSTPA